MSEPEIPDAEQQPSEPSAPLVTTPIEASPRRGRPTKLARLERARLAKVVAGAARAKEFLELKVESRKRFANSEFVVQTPKGFRIEGASFEVVVELIRVLSDSDE